jgi:hypothetical protein
MSAISSVYPTPARKLVSTATAIMLFERRIPLDHLTITYTNCSRFAMIEPPRWTGQDYRIFRINKIHS